MSKFSKFILWLTLITLTTSYSVTARSSSNYLSGYVTQGFTYSSDNNYFGDSDDGISTDFSEALLAYQYQLSDRWTVKAQASYRTSSSLEPDSSLELASIEYRQPIARGHIRFSAGRLRPYAGLYSNIYNISAAWPMGMLPETTYPTDQRGLYLFVEGLQANLYQQLNNWSYQLSTTIGTRDYSVDQAQDALLLGLATATDLNTDHILAFSVSADHLSGFGFGFAHYDIEFDLSININIPAEEGAISSQYTTNIIRDIFYATKSWQRWELEVQWQRTHIDFYDAIINSSDLVNCTDVCLSVLGFFNAVFEEESKADDWHFSLFRHFNNGLTIYAGYGEGYAANDDREAEQLEQALGVPAQNFYLKQSFFGFKYDLNEHWAISTTGSLFEGSGNLIRRDQDRLFDTEKYWHALNFNISYQF